MFSEDKVEQHRRRSVQLLEILDTVPERKFEAIVSAARRIFGCRTSYISLLDGDRQWFKARQGFGPNEVARSSSICAMSVEQGRTFVVEDLQTHPEFGQMPAIQADPELRFFVTIPLAGPEIDGLSVPIGSLCVIDDKPHVLTDAERKELEDLAFLVEGMFASRLGRIVALKRAEERDRMVEEMLRTHRQFELAEQMANIGSWRLDLRTNVVEWSKQTRRIHELEEGSEEMLQDALDFYPPRERARIEHVVEACVASGKSYDLELDFVTAKGNPRRVRAIGEVEKQGAETVALIGVFQDVTDRHRMEEKLRQAAFTDELTGLANRKRLNDFLDEEIWQVRRSGKRLAVVLLDLDNFKQANDRFGHDTGDKVLCHMAARLREPPFNVHLAARLGGDEFLLVIEEGPLLTDLDDTLETLVGSLQYEIATADAPLRITATAGAAWLTAHTADRSDLLKCADIALYRAKDNRRGSFAIYSPESPLRKAALRVI